MSSLSINNSTSREHCASALTFEHKATLMLTVILFVFFFQHITGTSNQAAISSLTVDHTTTSHKLTTVKYF